MTERRPLLKIEDCAKALDVKLSWFYNGSAEKDGLRVCKIGKYLRVDADDFDNYLREKGFDIG